MMRVFTRGSIGVRMGLAAVIALATCGVLMADEAPTRPNILWLITEDMGPQLGCYGTPEVATPVLDKLAGEGVRFAYAMTVTPVCSTSRSAFCTGMYSTTIGTHQHRTAADRKPVLPEGVQPITRWFEQNGYYTSNMAGTPELNRPGKVDWNFQLEGSPFQGHEWSELKSHQPFYAQINFSQSHRAFSSPRHADPAQVELPPYYADVPEIRQDWAAYLDEITEVDGLIGNVLQRLQQDGMADNTIIFMFGDNGQAHMRGKQWLYDEGLHVPLIIHIPPALDRPEGYEPGTVDANLTQSIDLTATSLALAGIAKPPKMEGRVLYGPQREERRRYAFASRDRCDMTMFRIRSVRDDHYRYIRNHMPELPFLNINLYKEKSYPAIGVMRQLHESGRLDPVQDRFFAMTRPAEELYFLDKDRWEIHNLADSTAPEHQAALNRLRAELDGWIERTHDQGAIAEPMEIRLQVFEDALDSATVIAEVEALIRQQRASAGISPEYAAYLDEVEKRIEKARARLQDPPANQAIPRRRTTAKRPD